MLRFSANLGFLWADRPLLERIALAARLGFKAVEMHWPYDIAPEAVRDACAAHSVAMLGINTVRGDISRGENGLGALPGREAEFQAAIDQSIAWGRVAGATAIHAMAGIVGPTDQAEATATFTANLRVAADKAADAGMTLLLEPLNPRASPGYFYSTLARAAEMIVRVGKPNVKIMFDVHHIGVSEGDVLTKFERYLPVIGHIQFAAVPSRAEPDEGEVDFRAIFAAIERSSYAGWVGAEYRPRTTVEAGIGWVETLGVKL